MVTIRNIHLNKVNKLHLLKWIFSIGVFNKKSCQRLAETWTYCIRITQKYPDTEWLFWRGVEMVEILFILNMNIDTLCAALLLPLIDFKVVSEENLCGNFNKKIIMLIHGVKNITFINKLKISNIRSIPLEQTDSIHSLPLITMDELCCLIIKLAERVVCLREIKNASQNKQTLIAKECTNIYTPLASRLGINQIIWELEDYCFRYLHPVEYRTIANLLHERRINREYYIEKFIKKLRKPIKNNGIKAEFYGRPKHIYSIWRKMQTKKLSFNMLFDIRAVRIVTERLQDCYAVLDIIHTYFSYLPDEFDNYIINPKPNGYQSIHTVIFGPDNKTIEIQIRTEQMHKNAELGVAAHWKYKESPITNSIIIEQAIFPD